MKPNSGSIRGGATGSFEGSGLVNEFAAVPSFHFGWILLVGMAVYQTTRNVVVRAFAVVMPILMLLAIIFTANHYVIDAVIGGAVVLLALGAVRFFETHPLISARDHWQHRAHR